MYLSQQMRLFLFMVFSLLAQPILSLQTKAGDSIDLFPLLSSAPWRPVKSIVTLNEWKELDVDRMIKIMDRTQLEAGHWGLRHLSIPINDVHVLSKRQAIIKELVENEPFFNALDATVASLKDGEKALIAYWDKHNVLHRQAQEGYFSFALFKRFNNYVAPLEILHINELFAPILYLTAIIGARSVAEELGQWFWRYRNGIEREDGSFLQSYFRGCFNGLAQPIRQHSFTPILNPDEGRSFMKSFDNGTMGDQYNYLQNSLALPGVLAAPIVAFKTLCFDIDLWYNVRRSLSKIHFLYNLSLQLHHEMVVIADFFEKTEVIYHKLKQSKHLSSGLPAIIIGKFVNNCAAIAPELTTLQDLLRSTTFEYESNLHSRGRVLKAHQIIASIKNKLIPLLQALGELDGYLSLAKIYKEHQGKKATFCFAECSNAGCPSIDLEDMWLPLLSSEKSVVNSISLGGVHGGRHGVNTGPNGGGKSTAMKSIAYAAWCFQSWGIVPARHASLSLFSSIITAIDPQENLSRGLSTFMAQKSALEKLKASIKRVQGTQELILCFLDEPYRGTIEGEANKLIFAYGKEIAELDNCMMFMATHLEKPTQLAQITHGTFVNYHMGLIEESPGIFRRTFILEPDAAWWWFHDEPKRERFINWLSAPGA